MDKPIKKITSFKRMPPPAPAAKPSNPLPAGLPGMMRPGTVLTEMEKEGLKQLGIVDSPENLPSNIADKIDKIVKDASKVEVPKVDKPLHIPEPVDFSELPAEKKREIVNFIKEAAEETKKEQSRKPSYVDPPLDPKIFKEPEVIDDLISTTPQPKKEEAPKATAEPEKPNVPVSETGLVNHGPSLCPHCGWDTTKTELTEVSDDDKMDFVQSILGGIRFKKSYAVFGGKITIVFRSLTTAESDMAYKQLIVDAQNDLQSKILSDTSFYWRTLMAYRAMMSIERIESTDNVIEVPPITEIEVDASEYPKPNTKLFALFDNLIEQLMPTEVMRNTVTHLYTEFNSLCEKLQAMAESKDFWQATK
jgi:hypothetical protein